ncbi:MAG: hypothetical protein JWO90_1180 [Solirubrobacterales bacterium]|nr:hypothetical protein [Solirubrobacterales bacterium]
MSSPTALVGCGAWGANVLRDLRHLGRSVQLDAGATLAVGPGVVVVLEGQVHVDGVARPLDGSDQASEATPTPHSSRIARTEGASRSR